jgi:CHAD domain-containing protein
VLPDRLSGEDLADLRGVLGGVPPKSPALVDAPDRRRYRHGTMTEVRSARPVGSAALDVEALHHLLASSFEVSVGKPGVVSRTSIDTFDRRLERAGQRLQLVAEAGKARLELVHSGETLVSVLAGTGPRWPAMAGALPDGAVKDHVARLAGIRALLVVDKRRRLVHRAELRNTDRKIVVRLDVDLPADGGATPPPVVTVRPLRGYQKEADLAWRLVTTVLEPVTEEPATPRAASPSVADPESPARALLAAELTGFLQEVRDNLPGTIADVDTEFLHDVRVAVRRTRSLLKLGRPALPAHVREAWEPQFKWLGDLTTPVRDLDVYQLGLPEMAGWLVAASAADLEPFQAHLARQRAADRRILLRALRGARLRRLLDDWSAELSTMADSARSADGAAWSAGALARANVERAHRRVVRGGTSISDSSPPEDLHLLRKRCKELRYALEMFAPVLDGAEVSKAIKDLKSLQDVLGRFQDSEVQRITLRGFAQEMVADGAPAEALLAMGELMGHLYAEQQRARAEFATAFASYTRPASRQRMAHLLGSGGKAVG